MSPHTSTERDGLLKNETPSFSQESDYESDESPDVYAAIRVLDLNKEPKVPLHFEVNPSAMQTTFLEDLKGFSPGRYVVKWSLGSAFASSLRFLLR